MTTITKLKAALAEMTDHCSPRYGNVQDILQDVIAEMEAGEPVAWRCTNWSGSPDDYIYRDADDCAVNAKGEKCGEALYLHPQPKAEPSPAILKVVRGDICCKSLDMDQSYGMWVPVTYSTEHGFVDGTCFYTHPQPKAEPSNPVEIDGIKKPEPVQCLDCGSNNLGVPANYDSVLDSVKTKGQEPVAWYHGDYGRIELSRVQRVGWKPLYAAAPQAKPPKKEE